MLTPLQEFIKKETAGGWVLLVAAVVALLVANSPFAESWKALWDWAPLGQPGGVADILPDSLKQWVKDGLMSIFFFVVGLEMKRELVSGHLRDRKVAKLPLLMAVGGMAVPALVFAALVAPHGAEALRGWALPSATDIAFALGLMALLGPKVVPTALKVLLLAVAIFDDLGAMLVIALFYSGGLQLEFLLAALGGWLLFAGLTHSRLARVGYGILPLLAAGITWLALLPSGLHPSVGAVALAAMVPTKTLLPKLEHALHPWVAFAIMPLYALSAAGVDVAAVMSGLGQSAQALWVLLGVVAGLALGKPVGIMAAVWLAERFGWAQRPAGIGWAHIAGLGAAAGIGFTMSLFIGYLAYVGHPELLAAAKAGVLLGSVVSGVLAVLILRGFAARRAV